MDLEAEESISLSLKKFRMKSVATIGAEAGVINTVTSRTVWALSKRLLKEIPEFNSYAASNDLQVRSIILSPKRKPTQSMSFASFDYAEILSEQWEDSDFFKQLQSRFIFMRYQTMDDGTIVFDGVKFWSMPSDDIAMAQAVWQKTVNQIRDGKAHALPTIGESPVAHVRPRAANAADRTMTTDGTLLTKKCFWLNASYIANHVF